MADSVQQKATEAGTILTRKKDVKMTLDLSKAIQKHLKNAKVIKTPPSLQVIFKNSATKSKSTVSKRKGYSIFNKQKKEHPETLIKTVEDTEKCRNGEPFSISFLEKLLLDEKVNLREYTVYKRFKQTSMKYQLQSIGKLIKDHYGDSSLKTKSIKLSRKNTENQDSFRYKNAERDYTLNRITDFNKTS